MYIDVSKLRDFYYRSALGRSVQVQLQQACRQIWPDIKREILVGYGFSSPLLRPFSGEVSHLVNLMPAEQGVMAWPPADNNTSVLCNEAMWPLGASSTDRLLALHALENAMNVGALIDEFWRVLTPEGRAILIVTNRVGIWAQSEKTPFGLGRPFGISQLENLLRAHRFEISAREGVLYGSPWRSKFGMKFSNSLEWMATRLPTKTLAGAWVLEIKKSHIGKLLKSNKKEPIFAHPELRPAGALRHQKSPASCAGNCDKNIIPKSYMNHLP